MTTRDFIARTFNTTSTKERRCSSVFADQDGNIYSYGYHYPLLFKVAGHTFINAMGYSSSTGRHIDWAWQAVDYDATPVKLSRDDVRVISDPECSDATKLETLAGTTARMVARAQQACDAKTRKDTRVYEYLQSVLEGAERSHLTVRRLQRINWRYLNATSDDDL